MANKLLWWHRLECVVHVLYGILKTPLAYMGYTFWRIRLTSHWISTISITMDSTYVRVISLFLIYVCYASKMNMIYLKEIDKYLNPFKHKSYTKKYNRMANYINNFYIFPIVITLNSLKTYEPLFKIKCWAVLSIKTILFDVSLYVIIGK